MNLGVITKYIPKWALGISTIAGTLAITGSIAFAVVHGALNNKEIEASRDGLFVKNPKAENAPSPIETSINDIKEQINTNILSDSDHDKKIILIGDDKFIHNPQVAYGLAKEYFNIGKYQLEIYSDYDKITNQGKKIINKIRYNDNYIGVVFGSIPHSASGINGYPSLIEYCQNEAGFPMVCVCTTENNSGTPKITKKSFKDSLSKIVTNYNKVEGEVS